MGGNGFFLDSMISESGRAVASAWRCGEEGMVEV